MLDLNEIASSERHICDLKQQLSACGDVFGASLCKRSLGGDYIEQITYSVAISLVCCFIRLLRSGQESGCRLLLTQGGLHIGIRSPHFVRNLILQRVDLGLRRFLVGVCLSNAILATSTIKQSPTQIQFRCPDFALSVVARQKILLTISSGQASVSFKGEGGKIGRLGLLERGIGSTQAGKLSQ